MRVTLECPVCHEDLKFKSKSISASGMNDHVRAEHYEDYKTEIVPEIQRLEKLNVQRTQIKRQLKEKWGYTIFGY